MRISRPLIGAAVGAGALGATLALGLTMASASTGSHAGTARQSPAAAATAVHPAAPTPAHKGGKHNCPGGGHGLSLRADRMPGGQGRPAGGMGGGAY